MNVLKSYIRTAGEEYKHKKIIADSDATLVPASFSGFLLTSAKVVSATRMIFLHYTAYTAPCKQTNSRNQQIFSRTTRSQVVGHPYHTTDSFYILTLFPLSLEFSKWVIHHTLGIPYSFPPYSYIYIHICFK